MLNGQIDSERAFRRFARDLSTFSTTVANHDEDLRTLIEDGSLGANELRVFLEDNEVELGELINNLVTTGEVVVKHLDGIEQLLVIYPYVVEGGYTVVSKSPGTGLYDAHFGMILTQEPHVCHEGYEGTDRRSPLDGSNRPMKEDTRCTAPRLQDQRPRRAEHPGARGPATGWGAGGLRVRPRDRRRDVRPRRDRSGSSVPVAWPPAAWERRRGSGSTSSPCWRATDPPGPGRDRRRRWRWSWPSASRS